MTTTMTSSPVGATTGRARLTADQIAAAAQLFGADERTAHAAAQNLANGAVILVGVSGKIASGKDTIAPLALDLWGAGDALRDYFANALKDEVDVLFANIRYWAKTSDEPIDPASITYEQRESLARFLSAQHSFPFEQALDFYTGAVAAEILANPALHARCRTDAIRSALQRHGTDVRRAQDNLYWVKRTLSPAVSALAAGSSVYFTDARFPNEVESIQALGGVVIRLDISPEVQRERLSSRDGLEINEEALTHMSETALDAYTGFDVRVDNNGTLAEALALIESALRDIGRL